MKAKRLNLCVAVRNSLINMELSTVKVVNAVNSALGELEARSEESKLGDGRVTKSEYKVTETTTSKYAGQKTTLPLLFDAWHSQVAKAEKIASFETIELPGIFKQWLEKFAKANEADKKAESAIASA